MDNVYNLKLIKIKFSIMWTKQQNCAHGLGVNYNIKNIYIFILLYF